MGYIPKLCLLKVKYLLELKVRDHVKIDDNGGICDNSKKAIDLINLIKQCKELALTAREVVHFLRRQGEVDWNHGREDLIEWNERKGDDITE